jgi:hypothetical protein
MTLPEPPTASRQLIPNKQTTQTQTKQQLTKQDKNKQRGYPQTTQYGDNQKTTTPHLSAPRGEPIMATKGQQGYFPPARGSGL